MSTPVTDPALKQEFIDAAHLVYSQNTSLSIGGLTPLLNANGAPVSYLNTGHGFFAEAFRDTQGNIVIAYEGTDPNPGTFHDGTISADTDLLNGNVAPALQDAVNFAFTVHQLVG